MFKNICAPRQEPIDIIAGCVEIYDNVLTFPEHVAEIAQAMEGWRDAEVYEYDEDSGGVNKSYRSNTILDMNADEYTTHPMFTYINEMVSSYVDDYCLRYEVDHIGLEPAQLLHYSTGQFYKRHFDTGPQFRRVVSALLYLNDVEEGGETHFNNFNLSVQPKAGRLVIFPSNYAYTHQAMPPVNGDKFVIVYWATER